MLYFLLLTPGKLRQLCFEIEVFFQITGQVHLGMIRLLYS